MKVPLIIKILFTTVCLCSAIAIIFTTDIVDKRISDRYTAIGKLRGDPHLDSAENRKRYIQAKNVIMAEIESLEKERKPYWYRYIGLSFAFIASLSLNHIISTLMNKRKRTRSA